MPKSISQTSGVHSDQAHSIREFKPSLRFSSLSTQAINQVTFLKAVNWTKRASPKVIQRQTHNCDKDDHKDPGRPELGA
ncbi:hypothetical protein PHISCL_05215 [Aspergillus sclerotialis]|uniref:Uncharacterized protein n=1 Tax=Aspergillus sclerotialis TaxID=2070753 RepID=A0A3A2ZGW9_9EURO|nr:hypothetical protein PHISCL_05215 [Aspergillus sclerotialis]